MHETQPLCGGIHPTASFFFNFDSDLELIHVLDMSGCREFGRKTGRV